MSLPINMTDSIDIEKPWKEKNVTPFISLKNLTKKFGNVKAVSHVSIDIYKGELFCLLGGSGSGKTTMLRMLAGFDQPDEGQILIEGNDISSIPPYRRPINMMFQSYALFPHMNVFQNIAYGLKREKKTKADIQMQVEEMLHLVKLEQYAYRKPHQLSGGQSQRVALARSLVKKPKLLLLDEPLGALDKKLREETQFEIVNIQEKIGITFIVVTHDQEEAMTLSTRIGVMKKGEIIQVDEPSVIYENPATKYVSEFIGSINIFNISKRQEKDNHVVLHVEDLEKEITQKAPFSDAKFYAIRPEKIFITRTKPENIDMYVRAKVDDIAYLGNISLYRMKLGNGRIIKVTLKNSQRHEDRITWEEEVYVSWDANSGIFLND